MHLSHLLPLMVSFISFISDISAGITLSVSDHRDVVTYRLHQKLLKYYFREIRPVRNPKEQTTVGMYCYLYQIFELDQKKNTIMLSGSFELFWEDNFLVWDPNDYDGLREIHLPPQKIWVPELSIYYSPGSHKMLFSDNALKVNYTGGVRWFLPFTVTALCPIDVKYFPFDEQICQLNFGPWAYTTDHLDFDTLAVDWKDYYDNQEWLLLGSNFTTQIMNYTYLNNEFNFTFAILILQISRQSFYYVFNLVIPTAIISIVSVIGFHMPGSSGQMRDAKFRLGIMTILSMTMLLLSIVDDMPKFSLQKSEGQYGSFSSVPLIGMYYFSLLGIIGVSTVTSSSFVAIERLIRQKNHVPWYIRALSWSPSFRMAGYQNPSMEPLDTNAMVMPNCGPGNSYKVAPYYAPPGEERALISPTARYHTFSPSATLYNHNALHGRPRDTRALTATATTSQTTEDRSVLLLQAALHDLTLAMRKLEKTVVGIRKDVRFFAPKNTVDERWMIVLYRLEWVSLAFYLIAISAVLLLFFYHGWY